MLNRIKKLWKLSKKNSEALSVLENLTQEQLDLVPDEGDGKAVFIGEGTEEEFKEQEKEDKGLSAWYKRIRNL